MRKLKNKFWVWIGNHLYPLAEEWQWDDIKGLDRYMKIQNLKVIYKTISWIPLVSKETKHNVIHNIAKKEGLHHRDITFLT